MGIAVALIRGMFWIAVTLIRGMFYLVASMIHAASRSRRRRRR